MTGRLILPELGRPGSLRRELAGTLLDDHLAGRMSRRAFIRRASVLGIGLSSAATILSACSSAAGETASAPASGGGATPGGGAGGTLRIGTAAPVAAVDPVTGFDTGSKAVWNLATEYLAWVENDGSLRPVLAETWEAAEEGASWTFVLREGVRFHDGSPLTADDVVATFERLTDPDGNSAALSAFATVLSAGGTSAVDDRTVRFDLDRPFSDFPYLVASVNHNAAVLKADYRGDFQAAPLGTGPFRLTGLTERQASFVAFDDYWQDGLPRLAGVEMRFYDDPQTQDLALQGGEIDTTVTPPQPGSPLYADASFEVLESPSSGSAFLHLRTDAEPFSDRRVRQAVAWSIDRQRIVDNLFDGRAVPGNDHMFAPVFSSAPTDLEQREADVERARSLLAEAGAEGVMVTLTTHEAETNVPLAELVQADCRAAGIEVALDIVASDVFYGSDETAPWLNVPMGIVEWGARGVPGQFVLPTSTCEGIWNSAKSCDPAFDSLLRDYDAALDEQGKAVIARDIAIRQQEETWTVVPFWQSIVRVARTGVTDLEATSSAPLDLSRTAAGPA